MPISSRVLEDSIRLTKIRQIKWSLYVVQIIMLVALAALLLTNREPNAGQIRRALSGNLCACGSYNGVVEAVLQSNSRKRRYGRR